jgi:uncharacterized protein YhaN
MSAPLHFAALAIRRMPGFPRGGPRLDDLSPGVNLVYGANASGKTTMAHALHAALWSGLHPAASLEARFELDGAHWLVDVDAQRAHWQRAGSDATPPPLPPAADADRYYLSLHGLLAADDAGFADHIRVESAGGYDVPAAARAAGFGTPPAPRSLVASLREARDALRAARDGEDALRRRVAGLDALRAEQRALAAEAGRLEAVRCALGLARADEERRVAAEAVTAFPVAMERLGGHELERLDELRRQQDEGRAGVAGADTLEADAEAALAKLGLGEAPVPAALLAEANELLASVRRSDEALSRARRDLAAADARLHDAAKRVGALTGRETPPDLGAAATDRIDRWLHDVERLRARRSAIEEGMALLAAATEREDAKRLDTHATLLREWLRAAAADDGEAARLRRLGIGAIVALVAVALLAFALAQPIVGGAAIAAALVLLLLRPAAGPDARAPIEARALAAGCAPDEWTLAAVQRMLDDLERRSAAAHLDAARAERLAALRHQHAALTGQEEHLRGERAAIAAALGIDFAGDDLSLYLLGTQLRAWVDAAAAAAGARAEIEALDRERSALLARLHERLAPYGYGPGDSEAQQAAIADLHERRERQTAALARRTSARDERQRACAVLEDAYARIAALFAAVDLSADEEPTLRDWCARLADLRSARQRLHVAEQRRAEADAALRALAPADETSLRAMAVAELEAHERAARAATGLTETLAGQIVELETELRQARRKHDVEDALCLVAAKRDELEDRRADAIEAAVGVALADWVAARSADRERPAVFHRAQQLFATITRGRYRLELDDAAGGAFRAHDTTTHRGHALDELSSGTRVQLLLAVRMAFVETQESAAALPLLLDEVLANCDDPRATAIIDAAVALARAGRQIFYFTAQPDEVAKWRAALDAQQDVPWAVHTLSGARGVDVPIEWPAAAALQAAPPAPDTHSHAEYGRLLDVPPFDPWSAGIGGLHLWYVVEDPHALHALLAAGIERWGQLEHFARSSRGRDGAAFGVWQRARPLAMLADRFHELWRSGRSAPVDSAAIARSGAVSSAFAEPVEALRRRVNGDAAALLAALENGEVRRFRSDRIEELRSFFAEQGHITSEQPHTADHIRIALLAGAADFADGDAAPLVDRLIARLTGRQLAPAR